MKKWLTNNFLPMWAKETVLAENKTLQKRNRQLEQEIAVLKAKLYGMETVLKMRCRQCLTQEKS
jgi:cell division protein FtsB